MEIEGDAVFFYRFGKTPGHHEIIQQSKNIFKKFHGHLLKYESQRICQYGACRTAGNLTLKFIIHKEIASSFRIGEHFKLMGKEIIILHRLLKNKIPENSYLLFTESLFTIFNDDYLKSKQLATTHYSEEFDDVLINYKSIPIDLWLQEIEPVGDGTNDLPTHFFSALSASKPIEAPATEVFTYITNLSIKCSPTRMALAIMAKDGFTAPLETKKLPSTTYRLSISCALQLMSKTEVNVQPPAPVPMMLMSYCN